MTQPLDEMGGVTVTGTFWFPAKMVTSYGYDARIVKCLSGNGNKKDRIT